MKMIVDFIVPSRHLLVQIQQWKHQEMCEICSKLTIGNFKQISNIDLVFPLLILNKCRHQINCIYWVLYGGLQFRILKI